MRRLLCRLFGHRWSNPEPIHFRLEGYTLVAECRRCGHTEMYSTFALPAFVLSPGSDHA